MSTWTKKVAGPMLAVIAAFAGLWGGVSCRQRDPSRSLIFAGGGMGGGTYATMTGLARIAMKYTDLDIKVVPGAGLVNLVKVATGKAHLTIGNVPFMMLARDGKDPFDRAYPGFRTLVQPGGGDVVTHFIVTDELPFDSVAELVARRHPLRLAVDRVGTHDNWILRKVLELHGAGVTELTSWGGSLREAGYNEQTMLLTDGHVSGVFQNMQFPSASLMEASSRRGLKFLGLSEEAVHELETMGWERVENPQDRYEQVSGAPPVTSVGYRMPLIVNAEVPEDVAYQLTKSFCEHIDETRRVHRAWENFDPDTAWQNTGGELHPGAVRYFRERGMMQ